MIIISQVEHSSIMYNLSSSVRAAHIMVIVVVVARWCCGTREKRDVTISEHTHTHALSHTHTHTHEYSRSGTHTQPTNTPLTFATKRHERNTQNTQHARALLYSLDGARERACGPSSLSSSNRRTYVCVWRSLNVRMRARMFVPAPASETTTHTHTVSSSSLPLGGRAQTVTDSA